MIRLPSPPRLGLPPKFTTWRSVQQNAILMLAETRYTYNGILAPTGSGKTAIVYGLSQMLPPEDRILYLTSTKSLMKHITDESAVMGVRPVSGKANYRCIAASSGGEFSGVAVESEDPSFVSVEHGPCFTAGMTCSLLNNGCTWFDGLRAARKARVVVSNYAKWITTAKPDDEFGKFAWIVCDEAGDVEGHLSDALHIEIERHAVESLLRIPWPGDPSRTTLDAWKQWAGRYRSIAESTLKQTEEQVKEALAARRKVQPQLFGRLRRLRELVKSMQQVRTMRGEWVHDGLVKGESRTLVGTIFDPVWPGPYADGMLFRKIPRVVLMSATLREKELDILGVPANDRQFVEFPSTFAVMRRPIVFIKGYGLPAMSARVEHTEAVRAKVCSVMDELIEARLDRKGIGHAVSYGRRNWLLHGSAQKRVLVTHSPQTTQQTVERFKAMAPPAFLLSPSVDTGQDFPDDMARWCFIPKLPFGDTRSAVIKRRMEIDKSWGLYQAAKKLIQMAGRGMRHEYDWFETIVTDQQFSWFPWANRDLFPKHFLDAIRTVDKPPAPLKVWTTGKRST